MKRIISISFTSSSSNFDTRIESFGKTVRVTHYGADFDSKIMTRLIRQFDGEADVIALSGIHSPVQVGRKIQTHPSSEVLKAQVKESLLVTGEKLRNTYMPWVLRDFIRRNPGVVDKRRVGFYSGILDRACVNVISEVTDRLVFMDPFFHLGVPMSLKSVEALDRYTKRIIPIVKRRNLQTHIKDTLERKKIQGFGLQDFLSADVFVTRQTMLERFSLEHLKGKTLLIDTLSPRLFEKLRQEGVANILSFMPDIEATRQEPRLGFAAIEGLLQCHKTEHTPITDDDILTWITEFGLKPGFKQFQVPMSIGGPRKFAFIIHPLTASQIFWHPALRPFYKLSKSFEGPIERMVSVFPGIHYGAILGIKSEATGVEAEGMIYSLFETPRMILQKDPEDIYDRLVRVAENAAAKGCEIIGLGAYTKIAGDGGVTVEKRSPIPVTTGNSLSAAATLWAARDAMGKLGFLPPWSGTRLPGRVMIIGATGAIGAVSAKLLAQVFEEVIICARRPDILLQLKREVEEAAPGVRVSVTTNPNLFAPQCDLIVTSTSSHDKKVLDIMKVKPGCVICDVSRPLDISEEDARKRPDVLVVESGEIELPGLVRVTCDIGTPDDAVYACLAETALLALEGRMESFTLSRSISYQKVQEIYDIARRHGAKLAAIRGHAGIITDREIALCREHAERALSAMKKRIEAGA